MSDPYAWPVLATPTTAEEHRRASMRALRDITVQAERRADGRPESTRNRCVCAQSMSSGYGCDVCLSKRNRILLTMWEQECRDADEFARDENARELREAS